MQDLYKILGVSRNASTDEIKSAYRRIVKNTHPDMNGGSRAREAEFIQATEAYSVLSNTTKRKEYDDGIRIEYEKSDLNATIREINEFIRQLKSEAKKYQDIASNELMKGVIWLIIGLAGTFITYYQATQGYNGGTYYVLWGFILFGAIQAIRGFSSYNKINRVLKDAEKEMWEKWHMSQASQRNRNNKDTEDNIEKIYLFKIINKLNGIKDLSVKIDSSEVTSNKSFIAMLAWLVFAVYVNERDKELGIKLLALGVDFLLDDDVFDINEKTDYYEFAINIMDEMDRIIRDSKNEESLDIISKQVRYYMDIANIEYNEEN